MRTGIYVRDKDFIFCTSTDNKNTKMYLKSQNQILAVVILIL
jgi:hypothetical protein